MSDSGQNWEEEEITIVGQSNSIQFLEAAEPQESPDDNSDDMTVADIPERTQMPEDYTVGRSAIREEQVADAMAWLVITRTPSVRKGQQFTLTKVRTDIGRGADVNIFLNDPNISALHAAIRFEYSADHSATKFVLYDLASTNGTFLNGQRIVSPAALTDGDRILMGETEVVFKQV